MKGYLMKLDDKVKQRIKSLQENDEAVEQNEEKIREMERLVTENEQIIKQNHDKIKENKSQITLSKNKIAIDTSNSRVCKGDYKGGCDSNSEMGILSLTSLVLRLTEENLELCKDNLQRTIEDRDRIIEIQNMCISSTKRNKHSLVILQENISEMMAIARVLLCLTEEEDMREEIFGRNGLLKQRQEELKLWNESEWKQNLINLLQLLFDKREKVFDYKTCRKEDRLESIKRKTPSPEITATKRLKLIRSPVLAKSSETFLWRLENISQKMKVAAEGGVPFVLSGSFLSHSGGYKLCLCAHLRGYGDGWESHLCVSYHMMRGEHDHELQWPFTGTVIVALIDQETGQDCHVRSYSLGSLPDNVKYVHDRPTRERNVGWGDAKLMSLEQLSRASSLIQEDVLLIKGSVQC